MTPSLLYYLLLNWTLTLSPGSSGYIRATPNSVTITGSNGELLTNTLTDFTIPINASGTFSFQWHYNTTDYTPRHDVAGVLIAGSFIQLSVNSGAKSQRGIYRSGFLVKGTVIGFRVKSTDNMFGSASFTVTKFMPPKIEAVD